MSQKLPRDVQILMLFADGMSREDLATKYRVSIQRVAQVMDKTKRRLGIDVKLVRLHVSEVAFAVRRVYGPFQHYRYDLDTPEGFENLEIDRRCYE